MKHLFSNTAFGLMTLLPTPIVLAQQSGQANHSSVMPADFSSPPADPPEGQEIRRYAVDDPGTGATNFGVAPVHDNMLFYMVRGDRFEYRSFDGGEVLLWDAQGWIGRDYNKLFFESEGEYSLDEDTFESAQTELLYGRAISSFWDFRAGLRYDFDPDPDRAFAVVGMQGLAPQWFEVDANLYLSEDGDVSFGMEAEYDVLLTQRLVLQPRMELEIAAQDSKDYDTYAGFTGVELGLRLRYEISRKFAPYVGVSWESALGETADIAEDSGGDPDTTSFVAGIKFWF
ncbi:copper resistance protein B [Pelagicoccus enzymogenes]|uniref:copper resistance protein B n=1 Tax=Pelagicoccus enzymogenes TaxID=2773457 RepID=UPI00280EA69B|nr:copper resistance protein B [Pelagicoccus enzymogenes]MDQ8198209.1 copper resistance protein B [Pelagicoccus enzymogenes]